MYPPSHRDGLTYSITPATTPTRRCIGKQLRLFVGFLDRPSVTKRSIDESFDHPVVEKTTFELTPGAELTLITDLDSKNGTRQQAVALMLGQVDYSELNRSMLVKVVERLIPFVSREVGSPFAFRRFHLHESETS
jgi:hypothetical protein